MTCDEVKERLADFLLDELPEREAVLVQEHLNLCPSCMKNYRELKGTGKALSAVPAARPVNVSEQFRSGVRAKALAELRSIVSALPPEKRLKIEARRAERMSRALEKQPPESRPAPGVFTKGVLVLAAACVAATVAIFAVPRGAPRTGERPAMGALTRTTGKVEQFFQKSGEPYTQVLEGKQVFHNETYLTGSDGLARFEFADGGTLLAGTNTRLTLRAAPGEERAVLCALEQGDAGFRLPAADAHDGGEGPRAGRWEVRTGAGTIVFERGSHAYLRIERKNERTLSGELLLLTGAAEVFYLDGNSAGRVAGQRRVRLASDARSLRAEALKPGEALVPAWRVELTDDAELSRLAGVPVKTSRGSDGALRMELHFSRESDPSDLLGWQPDPSGNLPQKSASRALTVPANTRVTLNVPLCAPIQFELACVRDTPRDATFAFGALDRHDSGVAIDISDTARLQVRENGRTARSQTTPLRRNGSAAEHPADSRNGLPAATVRLDLQRESNGLSAALSTPAQSSAALPCAKGKPGELQRLWIQSLGDPASFDDVRITGALPGEWLRGRLAE